MEKNKYYGDFTHNKRGDKIIKIEICGWSPDKITVYFDSLFIGNKNYLFYNLDGSYFEDPCIREEMQLIKLQ